MADNEGPRLIYLGSFEGGVHHLTIPRAPLEALEQKLAAERASRELAAEKMKLATMQSARANGRLRKALTAVFGRRMK
jgi:hypothetical protein